MDWSAFTTGRFYSSGCVYYDTVRNQFNDIRESGIINIPAKYSLVPVLTPGAADKANDDWLPMPFDKASAILEFNERDFLLKSLDQAIERYCTCHNSPPSQGTMMVVPAGMAMDIENSTFMVASNGENVDSIRIYFLLS